MNSTECWNNGCVITPELITAVKKLDTAQEDFAIALAQAFPCKKLPFGFCADLSRKSGVSKRMIAHFVEAEGYVCLTKGGKPRVKGGGPKAKTTEGAGADKGATPKTAEDAVKLIEAILNSMGDKRDLVETMLIARINRRAHSRVS